MIKTPTDLKNWFASLVDRSTATKDSKTVKVELYITPDGGIRSVKHSVHRVDK